MILSYFDNIVSDDQMAAIDVAYPDDVTQVSIDGVRCAFYPTPALLYTEQLSPTYSLSMLVGITVQYWHSQRADVSAFPFLGITNPQ